MTQKASIALLNPFSHQMCGGVKSGRLLVYSIRTELCPTNSACLPVGKYSTLASVKDEIHTDSCAMNCFRDFE